MKLYDSAMAPNPRRVRIFLAEKGVDVEVVNARFVKPLDEKGILDLARRHERIMTLEDHSVLGGFGSALWVWVYWILFQCLWFVGMCMGCCCCCSCCIVLVDIGNKGR